MEDREPYRGTKVPRIRSAELAQGERSAYTWTVQALEHGLMGPAFRAHRFFRKAPCLLVGTR
jgi:hypothetical protein